MKVLLIDNDKILKYEMSSRVDDSFLLSFIPDSNKEYPISFKGINNEWYLTSNGTSNIVEDGKEIDQLKVEYYQKYTLKIVGYDNLIELYVLPNRETLFKFDFSNLNEFSVGSNVKCNIIYNSKYMTDVYASFKLVGDDWVIAAVNDDNYKLYINGVRAKVQKLKFGDDIFIAGLRITWMKKLICVNNPLNLVRINNFTLIQDQNIFDSEVLPVSEDDKHVTLYKKDDYFFHFPLIRNNVSKHKVSVDAPPESKMKDALPAWLTIGSSIVMCTSSVVMIYNVYNGLNQGKEVTEMLPQIIMAIGMLIGGIIMPTITKAYQKNKTKKYEKMRTDKYTEYLHSKERELQLYLSDELQLLNSDYMDADNCLVVLEKRNKQFWWRETSNQDFLKVRLGVGKINSLVDISAPEKHFSLETDELLEYSYKIKEKYQSIENAPITISLKDNVVTSIVCTGLNMEAYINSLILQLIILHSSIDLKIVCLTSDYNKQRWEFLKYIPHIFSDDNSIRFFASGDAECKYVTNYLEGIYKDRKEKSDENSNKKVEYPTHYLVITDDYVNVKSLPLISDLINSENTSYGFSILIVDDNIKQVPSKNNLYIEVDEKDGFIMDQVDGQYSQRVFMLDKINDKIDLYQVGRLLSNIPVDRKELDATLPTSLSFLDMFGVPKIEQLNITNRWQTNNPIKSLETVIGVHPNGDKFKLDLHEKYHGPHGLIAGSTGSGKSEFIITWILSMAINYHPYEVQFILIDYKGGGLAGAFENKENGIKIPHLVGTITNLDKNSMNRSLMSIQSEVTRRQKVFSEVRENLGEGTLDIYKYQKLYRDGIVKNPMAHLFIVCDEFAELKQQQPEFMEQLISVSRIGRSLGVHLILATQKPSGVVNDQIWANSKFKVCLKVQDKSDSIEMLKRPEAASLKETGRFYLQVGYDELFELGQSGWSGAKYVPSDKIVLKVDESINIIDDVGYTLKSNSVKNVVEDTKDYGDQLTNIVKYLNNIGENEKIITNKLWLDAIPEIININDLKRKYNWQPESYHINPVIGEYDDPFNQLQNILTVDLSKKGNLLVYGTAGSGKENLLMNIIRSSIVEHTPDELNIYIIDCGSESLRIFNNFPHVGDVFTMDDKEEINDLIKMLSNEIEKRKSIFADYAGSYNDYVENSTSKMPFILVVINGYDNFQETFENETENLQGLFRDGSKYGIAFAIGVTGTQTVRNRMQSYFTNKICLHLNDPMDYRTILNSNKDLLPADYFGRGIIVKDKECFEFQTGVFADKKNQTQYLRDLAVYLNKSYVTRAKKTPSVPKRAYVDDFMELANNKDFVPIGYSMYSKNIYYHDLKKNPATIVMYDNENINNTMFIRSMIKLMSVSTPTVIIDTNKIINESINNTSVVNDELDYFIENFPEYVKSKDLFINLVIVGLNDTFYSMKTESKKILESLIANIRSYPKLRIVIYDSATNYKEYKMSMWFKPIVDKNVIFVGNGIFNQSLFNAPDIDFKEKKKVFECMGYAINQGNSELIKHIVDGDDNNG